MLLPDTLTVVRVQRVLAYWTSLFTTHNPDANRFTDKRYLRRC